MQCTGALQPLNEVKKPDDNVRVLKDRSMLLLLTVVPMNALNAMTRMTSQPLLSGSCDCHHVTSKQEAANDPVLQQTGLLEKDIVYSS